MRVGFTEDEKELMVKLPRKEFTLSNVEVDGALLGVADILFAYAYNVRSNEGEHSVESAWTVCKLSSTLSCLDWFQTPREMAIACCRRALCFPLYRSWALCRKLLKDVRMILRLGRNQVLKCFFEIHKLLSNDEPRYILNDLYISDYCVWLQSISNERLAALEQQIGEAQLEKKDIGLDLDDLEEAASVVEDDEMRRNGTEHREDQTPGHHGNPSLQEHSMDSDQPQVIHQVGYPDLIRRATPGPDVVTAHIVRAAETVAMERDDDSDDSDDEDNVHVADGGVVQEHSMKESGTSSQIPKTGSSSDVGEVSNLNHCSPDNDSVNKVIIASTDCSDDRLGQVMPSSTNSLDLPHSGSPSRTMHIRRKDEQGNDREDEVEVVETMQDMLNHLSLDPSIPSSSSSSSSLSLTSSGHKSSSNKEWAEKPPTKLVEMFEDK
eukprot:XP_011674770.1 PREDICTED: protein SHQ1 homolog [Strongylocentrotus purpuratus]